MQKPGKNPALASHRGEGVQAGVRDGKVPLNPPCFHVQALGQLCGDGSGKAVEHGLIIAETAEKAKGGKPAVVQNRALLWDAAC